LSDDLTATEAERTTAFETLNQALDVMDQLPNRDALSNLTEMQDPYATAEPEPDIFSNDHEGIEAAARELTDSRRSAEEAPPITPRVSAD
jgi:hypothetical protein